MANLRQERGNNLGGVTLSNIGSDDVVTALPLLAAERNELHIADVFAAVQQILVQKGASAIRPMRKRTASRAFSTISKTSSGRNFHVFASSQLVCTLSHLLSSNAITHSRTVSIRSVSRLFSIDMFGFHRSYHDAGEQWSHLFVCHPDFRHCVRLYPSPPQRSDCGRDGRSCYALSLLVCFCAMTSR